MQTLPQILITQSLEPQLLVSPDRLTAVQVTGLGNCSTNEKQKEAIVHFINGNDCFVSLPTGYGKSLCYPLERGFVFKSQSLAVFAVAISIGDFFFFNNIGS